MKQLVFFGEEELGTLLQLAYRGLYFIYWIIDNLSVAAKIKIFTADWKFLHALGLKIRVLALTVSLTSFAYQMRFKEMSEEQRYMSILKGCRDLC